MLTIVYTIMAAIALVILGRALSANSAVFDTRRLPIGMRFTAIEMEAVAAATRFCGWLVLVGGLTAAMILTAIGS